MAKHVVIIFSTSVLLILCMFLPFLPGRYDSLATTLSFMTQLFGFAGLLLVPLGLFWLWFEITKHKKISAPDKTTKSFTITAILVLAFVTFIVSLGALTNYNLSFGIFFLIFCVAVLARTYFKVTRARSANLKINPVPVYLITIPLIVAIVRLLFIGTGVQYSREYAIRNSAPLIEAIETYYAKNGDYPRSLQALHTDILPGVIGIKQYHYEQNGRAYNVYFKQFSDELDVEEIVMYNKLDEHAYSAHVMDILEYSGAELALRRGDRHKYQLLMPHWIYIKFD